MGAAATAAIALNANNCVAGQLLTPLQALFPYTAAGAALQFYLAFLDSKLPSLPAVAAAITAAIAVNVDNAWWVDPVGAIAISAYILWRWFDIARTQGEGWA